MKKSVPKFKKITIGEWHEYDWLIEALKEYIKKNPMIDDIEIIHHFKMRVDMIADALTQLRIRHQIERHIIDNVFHYTISNSEEDAKT